MVAIIDYGVGNLFSLQSSFRYIGVDCVVSSTDTEIRAADHVVLPGVGAFGDAIDKLRKNRLDKTVIAIAKEGRPLLGICLGMQLLFERSFEYGEHQGLGILPGNILLMTPDNMGEPLKVPHMGWNSLDIYKSSPLLRYINPGDYVYYVHSYYAPVSEDTAAGSRYGNLEVSGVVGNGNVCGTQFHPEKSGNVGLNILRAFVEMGGA